MRTLMGVCLWAVVGSSCAGFTAVERGDWRRVYLTADGAHGPDSPQEIITADQELKEREESVNRAWNPPPGFKAPSLADSGPVSLKVGEVATFVVEEPSEVQVLVQGAAVRAFWNPTQKKDGWKDGADVTRRESTLFLVGRKEGAAAVRVVTGDEPWTVPVTVTP